MNLNEKRVRIFLLRLAIGLVIGAVAGYAYHYYIGCGGGSCSAWSSPVRSTLFGMLLGAVLLWDSRISSGRAPKE